MKINIYYGGRGLIEDPTIYVINKLTEVLEELRVDVSRYNLYEEKNSIAMLPKTLKDGRWCNTGHHCRMDGNRRLNAAIFRCLLAIWR